MSADSAPSIDRVKIIMKTLIDIVGNLYRFVPFSQVAPMKPIVHLHENKLPLLVQTPPFLQGDKSHGSG